MTGASCVQAVVFDWAGTIIDYGSQQPALAFQQLFAEWGIRVSIKEIRQHMGMNKGEHIQALLNQDSLKKQWIAKYTKDPDQESVQALLTGYEKALKHQVQNSFDFIPGFFDVIRKLREMGLKIGTSTGYTRNIVDEILRIAEKNGFIPDAAVCASDVPKGRPYPWMCYLNAIHLNVYPMQSMIKIGDTLQDIRAGFNAGMWTVGVTQTGNELGLSEEEVRATNPEQLDTALKRITDTFKEAGADYVVTGIWEIIPVVTEINEKLKNNYCKKK
jgi:phosphonoacetaldehyde hydrolase